VPLVETTQCIRNAAPTKIAAQNEIVDRIRDREVDPDVWFDSADWLSIALHVDLILPKGVSLCHGVDQLTWKMLAAGKVSES